VSRAFLLVAFVAFGCAHARPPATSQAPKEGEPDLSAMLELAGRFGFAHGCPVGPNTIYTAGHVTDERPFESDVELYPLRMSDGAGREDLALPVWVDRAADVALMRPAHGPLAHWFPLVTEPPKPGERLWNLGYRLDSRRDFLKPRSVSAIVVRAFAGHLALTLAAGHGSSGACWVNALGQAVALEVGGADCQPGAGEPPCAYAAGLWPPWRSEE
jgi:hypothetical protein